MKWCSVKNKKIEDGFDIKDLVENILVENNMDKKRPRQMDQDDFLKLLYCFNAENIHFAS